MHEVKLSTTVNQNSSRLAVKLNIKELGVNWNQKDVVRVFSYKEDGTIVLKRVGTKSKKTVAHKLTSTGSGDFNHDLGIYMSHTPHRFRGAFKNANSVPAAARFLDKEKTMLQVYMPTEIFAEVAA